MKIPGHGHAWLGLLVAVGFLYPEYYFLQKQMPPLERYYLKEYVLQEINPLGEIGPHARPKPQPMLRLQTNRPDGPHRECPVGSQYVTSRTPSPFLAFTESCLAEMKDADYYHWLRTNIYGGKDSFSLFGHLLFMGCFQLFGAVILGILADNRQRREALIGKQLRGMEIVDRYEFNRKVKGDGLYLKTDNRRNLWEWMQGERGKYLFFRAKHRNNHAIYIGDPGAGKTSSFFQELDQVEYRGRDGSEVAVIYDPHMQFIKRYYRPERGDIILNPFDERCPSWSPSDELFMQSYMISEALALGQAQSLFPGRPTDRNWFFVYCCQLIWKHCLVEHCPTADQMAELIQYSDPLIDIVAQGTELEQIMAKNSQNQRSAVVAFLAQIAFALRQIPERQEDRPHFVIRDYCRNPKGWIFITNTPRTRKGLQPIQGLWMNEIVMGLLSTEEEQDLPKNRAHVTVAYDEAQTAQQLPAIPLGLSEGRKFFRMAIGFQGRSQMKSIYEDLSEVIFSIPFTKFLLRTSESEAMKWLSEMIGDIEKEYLRETKSHNSGGNNGHSFTLDKRIEKLVLNSEFSKLDDLDGFIKYMGYILKVKMPVVLPRAQQAVPFIPRIGRPVVAKELPTLEAVQAALKLQEEEKKKRAKKKSDQQDLIGKALQAFLNKAMADYSPEAAQAVMEQDTDEALSAWNVGDPVTNDSRDQEGVGVSE